MQQLQDIKPALLPNATHRQRFTYKDKFQALRDRYEQVSAVRAPFFLPRHCGWANALNRQTRLYGKN
jgi:hypothetical protein